MKVLGDPRVVFFKLGKFEKGSQRLGFLFLGGFGGFFLLLLFFFLAKYGHQKICRQV